MIVKNPLPPTMLRDAVDDWYRFSMVSSIDYVGKILEATDTWVRLGYGKDMQFECIIMLAHVTAYTKIAPIVYHD